MMHSRKLLFLLLCLASVAWHEQYAAQTSVARQPANLGDLKRQALEYKRSGGYDRDVAAVLASARQYVERRAPMVKKPAIVLDIDETSLSNWPEIQANDFGTFNAGSCNTLPAGPCGVLAWENSAQDPAIAPTLALFNAAKAKGVAVFFNTGRNETLRAPTETNLRNAG